MLNPIVLSGAFLGWGLGANDSANIFGTAVSTKMVRYSTAIVLTAGFVILGAYVDGYRGIAKLSNYAFSGGINTPMEAFFVMLAAAITVAVLTIMKLPVSTSQAVIGAIIGGGLLEGRADFSASLEFFSAWVATPFGAMFIAFILYTLTTKLIEKRLTHFGFYEVFIRTGYLFAGIIGAYSLGANNVANVTALFSGQLGIVTPQQAALIGGISIAIGVLTYSKPVMSTVGESIVHLSPIAGLLVVISVSLTAYFYALIGIPVSTSQAVVGAIVGIGLKTGIKTIHFKTLKKILFGWIGTPTAAGLISFLLSIYVHRV
ncbi:MAG: inorganic phosphate transporter [Vallitaleaceae bacterium]|nr:inorganic phosphate transporter [Vallitaleaceae bacterium]